jgi:hypothetical protein
VIQRINGVLTDVGASRVRLQEQRAATLVLQDRVAQEVARCDGVLGRIVTARKVAAGPLLERDSVPVWQRDQLAGAVTELPERVRSAVAADVAQLRRFARDERWRLPAGPLPGLVVLMRRARRKAHLWVPPTTHGRRHPVVRPPRLRRAGVHRAGVHLGLTPAARGRGLPGAGAGPRCRSCPLLDPSLVLGLYILGVFPGRPPPLRFRGPLLERQIFLLRC